MRLSEGLNLGTGLQPSETKARARPIRPRRRVVQPPIHPRGRFTDDGEDFSLLCFQPKAVRLAPSPKLP